MLTLLFVGMLPSSSPAAHWSQLHLLLRYLVLQELRNLGLLHSFHDYVCGQRCLNVPWLVHGRSVGSPTPSPIWCCWNGHLPIHRRRSWYGSRHRQPIRSKGSDLLRLHLHLLLRMLLGSLRLGGDW